MADNWGQVHWFPRMSTGQSVHKIELGSRYPQCFSHSPRLDCCGPSTWFPPDHGGNGRGADPFWTARLRCAALMIMADLARGTGCGLPPPVSHTSEPSPKRHPVHRSHLHTSASLSKLSSPYFAPIEEAERSEAGGLGEDTLVQ